MRIERLQSNLPSQEHKFFDCLFVSSQWIDIVQGGLSLYGVFEADELQAVFPLCKRRKWFFSYLGDAPLTPYCGLVIREKDGNSASQSGRRKNIMTCIADFIDEWKVPLVSITFPPWITDLQPFIWRKYKVIVTYTYILQLKGKSDDVLLRNMNNTRRNQIRNGAKKGLEVQKCTDYSVVEALVARTLNRREIRVDSTALKKILYDERLNANRFAFVTYCCGKPVATTFCLFDKSRCYYLLGGFDSDRSIAPAGPMAMFEAIKHARDLDLDYFDFEGSSIPGIERYFRSFGGELTPVFRVVKGYLPIEMLLKVFKRHLF